jgi:cytochrome P450
MTRHADVNAALRDPRLVPVGDAADAQQGARAHDDVRAGISAAMPPAQVAAMFSPLHDTARRILRAIPQGAEVDLAAAYATPWSFELALLATRVRRDVAEEATILASVLCRSAARSTRGDATDDAIRATAKFARTLSAGASLTHGAYIVQSFVALTQSLPVLLCEAWRALFRAPTQLARLRVDGVTPRAVDELLRVGAPTRTIFRRVVADAEIGGAKLQVGDRVALAIAAANRDPEGWSDANAVDLARDARDHLALSVGGHRCAGASLVKVAVQVATSALLDETTAVTLTRCAPAAIEDPCLDPIAPALASLAPLFVALRRD